MKTRNRGSRDARGSRGSRSRSARGGSEQGDAARPAETAPRLASDPEDPAALMRALLDKLGERLAFERTGVRLYDALLSKVDGAETWDGAPTREQLEEFREQELAHFELVQDAIFELGGDPTVVTPSADVQAVASCGVLQVIVDARTTLGQSLEAMLTAELVDNDGWRMLIALAEPVMPERMTSLLRALEEEEEHLGSVRGWLASRHGLDLEVRPQERKRSTRPRTRSRRGQRAR